MPTIIDLGQKVKAKYPQYKDMSDEEVGRKVKAKYPTAYMDFSDIVPQQTKEQPKRNLVDRVINTGKKVSQGMQDFNIGGVKGALSTINGMSMLGQKVLKATVGNAVEKATGIKDKVPEAQMPESWTTPTNTMQKIGKGTEQIAEFMIPASKVSKVSSVAEKTISSIPKLGNLTKGGLVLASKMGIGAAEMGGMTALQTGGDKEAVKKAATVGAVMPVAGAVINKAGQGLQSVGKKIGSSVIRATKRDVEDGFLIDNVYKYNAGGSLENTLKTTNSQMNALSLKLKDKIGQSGENINLNNLFDKTAQRLGEKKATQFGAQTKISGALEQLKNEIDLQGVGGVVDLPTAQTVKRAAGTMGAWKYNLQDPESKASEKVYNTFYNILKTEIENKSPSGVKEINKALSELIPIHNAALRRLPIAERNNALSLTDSIGLLSSVFDPKALGVTIINNLMKSGQVANTMVKKGVGLTKPSKIAPIIKGAIVKSITEK